MGIGEGGKGPPGDIKGAPTDITGCYTVGSALSTATNVHRGGGGRPGGD
jgi:hypothetical protein